jgi:hypothetical protein
MKQALQIFFFQYMIPMLVDDDKENNPCDNIPNNTACLDGLCIAPPHFGQFGRIMRQAMSTDLLCHDILAPLLGISHPATPVSCFSQI